MEFNEKLQALRKENGLTQQQLADRLYVSRTAISKWESGKGYPGIDSLRAISALFSVTLDELLSPSEALSIAEKSEKEKTGRLRDLIYGLLDISVALLLFLPFFADRSVDPIRAVSLISLSGTALYIKAAYFTAVALSALIGIAALALQCSASRIWSMCKTHLSLTVGAASVVLFTVSNQPYAAIFAFTLLAVKALMTLRVR